FGTFDITAMVTHGYDVNLPVPFRNTVDHYPYAYFLYTPFLILSSAASRLLRQPWGSAAPPASAPSRIPAESSVLSGCDCEACGGVGSDCPCLGLGVLDDVGSECGPGCGCGPECGNRSIQNGVAVRVKIVRDARKGWCLHSDQWIRKEEFLFEYAGPSDEIMYDWLIGELLNLNPHYSCNAKKKRCSREAQIVQIYSATELKEAGVKFEVKKASQCLLDLQLSGHTLRIPFFRVEDITEVVLRNLLAFEQCHCINVSYLADYIAVLDFLINTDKDVDLLIKNGIIENWLGDRNAVAKMFNGLGVNIMYPDFNVQYSLIFQRLNAFCARCDYCNTPWKTISPELMSSLTVCGYDSHENEGLLAAFPKLIGTGKQHTYVETENVPEYSDYFEESICKCAFDLILISLGHKENVTVAQVKQYCEMESHEEKLHRQMREDKIREAKDEMKRKANEIDKNKIIKNRGDNYKGGFGPLQSMGSGIFENSFNDTSISSSGTGSRLSSDVDSFSTKSKDRI
ncbi:hypothetical protein S83_063107, partial [Arachis hypogaea]